MEVVKAIPKWFILSNYSNAPNLSSQQWAHELGQRIAINEILFEDGEYSDEETKVRFRKFVMDMLEKVKKYGLIANIPDEDGDGWVKNFIEHQKLLIAKYGGRENRSALRSLAWDDLLEIVTGTAQFDELLTSR